MSMPPVKYSVILPTHKRDVSALRALESVLKQNYDPQRFEVLIVANPHSKFLQDEVAKWAYTCQNRRPQCQYLTSRLGVNAAKNVGLEKARGEVMVFIDDDCEWISRNHFNQLDQHYQDFQTDGVGGVYIDPPNCSVFVSAYNLMSTLWLKKFVFRDLQTLQLLGGNSSYRRKCFENYRFDENILYGADEVHLNKTLMASDKKLRFDQNLSVRHSAHGDASSFFWRAIRQGQNKMKIPRPFGVTWPLVEMLRASIRQPREFFLVGCHWGLQQMAFLWQNK